MKNQGTWSGVDTQRWSDNRKRSGVKDVRAEKGKS